MTLKDSLLKSVSRLTGEILPAAVESAGHSLESLRKRLDGINRSLADRALPDDRKVRVSELSLSRKAERAGQKAATLRVVEKAKDTQSSL